MAHSQLISAKGLDEILDKDDVRVIDCRFDLSDPDAGRRHYEASHIRGAVFTDLNRDLASAPTQFSGRHPLPNAADLAATLAALGIGNDTEVVVYDAGNGAMAVRAWWLLRWLGHDKVRLLDGGLASWSSVYPLSSDAVSHAARDFTVKVRGEMVISTDEIEASGEECASLILLDARDPARFRGEVEPIDKVAGHVPGASNFPLTDSLTPDGLWKSQQELEALWRDQFGVSTQTPWVAMCGSGVTACHLALSAMQAGYREPRLYVGSWSEWIVDSGRPVARSPGENAAK